MRNGSLMKKRAILAWFLIMPVLLTRVFTALYPMLMTFWYSLRDYNIIRGTNFYIGLDNFRKIFSDKTLIDTLWFTFLFTFTSIILHLILGIAFAELMNVKFKGRRFIRTIMLIPWAMPLIVAGIAAYWMFNGEYGLINDILSRLFGIKPDWLVNIWGARFAVIITDVWKDTPFMAVMILAGLQGIDPEIYESATVDGAGGWKKLTCITLPMIKPVLITVLIFFTIWRMTSFDLVYAMTKGGPGTATSLLSYRVYLEGFLNLSFGYSSAIGVCIFLIGGIFGIAGLLMLKRAKE